MVLSFSEAAAAAVQGAACSLLAVSDTATQWINTAYGADADFGNIAGALRKNICNESNPDTDGVGPSDPGIPGGQCPGVSYNIEITASATSPYTDETYTFTTDADINGPITSYNLFVNNTRTDCTVSGGGDGQTNARDLVGRFRVFNDTGSELSASSPEFTGTWGPSDCVPDDDFVSPSDVVTPTAVVVTRNDGLPDDCGVIPPTVGVYNDYSETVSITYEDNSETTTTEDIDINIGPFLIGIGGAVYAPVTVTTGPIDIDGRLVIYPEFNVELSPFPPGDGPGRTDDPVSDPSEPDPTPAVGEREDRIIGVVVRVVDYDEDIASASFVAQDGSPDLYLPRVGNVSFFVEVGSTGAWTDPTPVRTVNSYIPCLAAQGAVSVDVTEETGFTLEVSAVYASLVV